MLADNKMDETVFHIAARHNQKNYVAELIRYMQHKWETIRIVSDDQAKMFMQLRKGNLSV